MPLPYGTFAASSAVASSSSKLRRRVIGTCLVLLSIAVVSMVIQSSALSPFLLVSLDGGDASDASVAEIIDIQDFLSSLPPEMLALVNASVDPCFDFHKFACGEWESTAIIPSDKTSASYTWDTDDKRRLDGLKAIMELDTGLVGTFYHACLDIATVNSLGSGPADNWMEMAGLVQDPQSLAQVIAEYHRLNMDVFFSWFVGTDHLNSSRSIMYLTNGGLNLPDKTYYSDETDEYKAHREAYKTYLKAGMSLFGFNDTFADQIVADTLKIETALAASEVDEDDLYKLQDVPPRYSNSGLRAQVPDFDWVSYFTIWSHPDISADSELLSITRPKWFNDFDTLVKTYSYSEIQNYLRAHVFNFFAPMLSEDFLDVMQKFDKDMYGTEDRPPRWKKCISAAKHAMPLGVGKLYVDKFVPPAVKDAATDMLEEIRSAFDRDLDDVSWMSSAVRDAARIKLQGIILEVAYPDSWPDYSELRFSSAEYVGNSVQAFQWATNDELNRLFEPTDRGEWDSSPAEINAFYSNGVNAVFIPGGILQPPFFSANYAPSQNYGSMGAIMGHELTHGFDNTGRKYDATGARKTWWDQSTIEQYRSGAQCIARLFDSYEAAGVHVHGNDTLGEDIADLGGLKTSYSAFVHKYSPLPNDKRRFWTAFAQSWCSVEREKALRLQVLTDPHAPDQLRIQGALSQLQYFADDFSCPVGSPMNPANKCVLW